MEDRRFDDLARRLATPITRRQAFKTIAAAALGGLVIRSGAGEALAARGGNSACANFCNEQFAPGPARGQCKSDAAHGQGLCYECGPGANPCSLAVCNDMCCARGASCTNGACACPDGQAVCGAGGADCFGVGICTDLTTTQNCGSCGNVCKPGEVCSNGRCKAGSPNPECAGASCNHTILCGAGSGCLCLSLFGGGGMCVGNMSCSGLQPCDATGGCPSGFACAVDSCCGPAVCVPTSAICPAGTASALPGVNARPHPGPTLSSR